ncbi:defective in cullin neddylation 1 protein [Rutstroemia sp. NJR-2017a BBW]|nr:defective in cullin neddylation 1 protein [Rutstroemia sp. NJR-2017a BBW]
MPPTASQRSSLSQFMQITGVQERTAARPIYLTSRGCHAARIIRHEFEICYFQASGLGGPPQAKEKETLTKLFDSYRSPNDEPDVVTVEGTMRYFTDDLGLNLENAEILLPCEIIQAPAIGEMSREGFVDGWKKLGLDTIPKQKAYLAHAVATLSTDEELFKRVYRNTFMCAKEKGQKALSLETAMVYWDLLFAPPGKLWQTGSTDWLKLWTDFLKQNWSKTVNRDMWNQTYVFHLRTMEDPSLGFWNEDGAWPSVVDEFVAWAKKNRGDGEGVDTMETD